jgi:hypothetical protein
MLIGLRNIQECIFEDHKGRQELYWWLAGPNTGKFFILVFCFFHHLKDVEKYHIEEKPHEDNYSDKRLSMQGDERVGGGGLSLRSRV